MSIMKLCRQAFQRAPLRPQAEQALLTGKFLSLSAKKKKKFSKKKEENLISCNADDCGDFIGAELALRIGRLRKERSP